MIGVVLWNDQTLNKAVIWCDDQGDLAFYSDKTGNGMQELNPGDWVEFDLTLGGNFRIADNLCVLMEQGSPELAERLSEATGTEQGPARAKGTRPAKQDQGTIVPFPLSAPEPRMHPAAVAAAKLTRR